MKKYQLWLQRKSYSQHLFNLMKIKYAPRASVQKTESPCLRTPSPTRDQTMVSRFKDLEDFHPAADKLGDISYAITYKQLKNRKLRIMKSFQIMNENISMARRIKEVKSVITHTFKDKTVSEHSNPRKIFEKKCQMTNEQLREQNFKQFRKWQNKKANPSQKYQLVLTVEEISKILHSQSEYSATWCQISTEKGIVRSELVRLDQFQGHRFLFSLEQELQAECLFRMYICKGLESKFVGQFQFNRPRLGQSLVSTHRSYDCQFEVTISQKYRKVRRDRPLLKMK